MVLGSEVDLLMPFRYKNRSWATMRNMSGQLMRGQVVSSLRVRLKHPTFDLPSDRETACRGGGGGVKHMGHER